MNQELRVFATFPAIFLVAYVPPLATPEFQQGANPSTAKATTAVIEALALLQGYARNHPLACVVPAVLIAEAITTFRENAPWHDTQRGLTDSVHHHEAGPGR